MRGSSMVLEGGSIDVNGIGTLLTTESCLLNKNRNPSMSRREVEENLRMYLGVERILWLGEGIAGDDTDGHVDDLARFTAPDTIAEFEDLVNRSAELALPGCLRLADEVKERRIRQVSTASAGLTDRGAQFAD